MRRRFVSITIAAAIVLALLWPGGAQSPAARAFRLAPTYAVQTLAPEAATTAGPREATPHRRQQTVVTAGAGTNADDRANTDDRTISNESTYTDARTANPPVAAPADAPGYEAIAQLEAELAAVTAAYGGRWGIVYEELAPLAGYPARIGINDRDRFYAASTTKLPTALCVYEQAAKGQLDLTETMEYLASDYWEGAGVLRYEEPGGHYTLRELTELALRHSDNVAQIMLERRIGYTGIDACMAWFGGEVADIVVNETTPSDMVVYLRALLRLQQREPELGSELITYLATTYYRHRIPVGLPVGIAVANKTGTWPDTNSDVAIVYLPGHPYVLTVFVEGIPEPVANEAIASVAAVVHRAAEQRAASLAALCGVDGRQASQAARTFAGDSCRAVGQ